MSHFCTWVVVPANCTDPATKATELLAPFDENEGSAFFKTKEGTPAKWDWYEKGGRWSGFIPNNQCLVAELPEEVPFALLLPDGSWHEKGEMGWFGITKSDEKDEDKWAVEVARLLGQFPEHLVLNYDLHI